MAQPTIEEERKRSIAIRKLNNQLRTRGTGGRIVITQGIQALPQNTLDLVTPTISNFSDFTDDNDPYEEHDFGSVTINEYKIFWKIDITMSHIIMPRLIQLTRNLHSAS